MHIRFGTQGIYMNDQLRTLLLMLALAISVGAQSPPTYVIRTVVGNGALQPVAAKDIDMVPGLEANLTEPYSVVLDSSGRVYFSDRNMVRRYDPATGLLTRIAGQFADPGTGNSFQIEQEEFVPGVVPDHASQRYPSRFEQLQTLWRQDFSGRRRNLCSLFRDWSCLWRKHGSHHQQRSWNRTKG